MKFFSREVMDQVRIGCFSGFWGDSSFGAGQLVSGGNVDYLVGDYLAEVTMGILARQRVCPCDLVSHCVQKTPKGGYVAEFVTNVWEPLMECVTQFDLFSLNREIIKKKIKVVTNAGAMNPLGLKKAIEESCQKANLSVVVAAVVGDDLTVWPLDSKLTPQDDFPKLLKEGKSISAFDILGEPDNLPSKNPLMSCNVYTGAFAIAEALASGAQVVVTGKSLPTKDSPLIR